MRSILLIGIGVCFWVGICQAGWTEAAREWASKLRHLEHFKTGEAATVRGVARAYWNTWNRPDYLIESVQSSHFKTGSIDVTLSLHRDAQGDVLRRPLVIFFPGVFGGNRSPSIFRAIQNYGPRGYHIAAIPNPWSLDYLRANPNANPGNPKEEAETVVDLIPGLKNLIGDAKVSKVTLVGESYGGFLSTAVVARDAANQGLIQGPVTIFGPPLHRNVVLENLDREFHRAKERNLGRLGWKKYLSLAEFLFSYPYFAPILDSSEYAHSIMYQEFQKNLVSSAQLIHKQKGVGELPHHQITFAEFVEKFTPENLNELGPQNYVTIKDWLNEIPKDQLDKIRIMTAGDDVLNRYVPQEYSWEKIMESFGEEKVIVLNEGGHLGFLEHPEFSELLDLEF